ncbi:hypothetical protein [Peribacillus frigoritolerans]|uniref:hypothetical protein n=1 Tax=Peribacillus frigoritolerans TaxID=450367 RepID=UPI0025A084E4|nr:hypothetical protein [Peribacillus frigoritolerans]MDM5313368.1 hypothetical protein [Peribacillus frigoritolerans]
MYMDKGIITEEEQILISRYPDEIQEKLKDILLKDKEISFSSNSYDSWIKTMEEGQEIIFIKDVVRLVGGFNDALFARALLQAIQGRPFKPLKEELDYDGRLEEFKQYPKGTRVKANGEVVVGV